MSRDRCALVKQGGVPGDCLVGMPDDSHQRACRATLRELDGVQWRLIRSAHLSRPEHYLSIYQSGCNHTCLKCHSWEFSQGYEGQWWSTDLLAGLAASYARQVTVWDPRERATMYHATDLCRSCGSCALWGEPGPLCPGALKPEQVVLGPQGFGPARNIVAFTGGDVACRADFYAEATERIKAAASSAGSGPRTWKGPSPPSRPPSKFTRRKPFPTDGRSSSLISNRRYNKTPRVCEAFRVCKNITSRFRYKQKSSFDRLKMIFAALVAQNRSESPFDRLADPAGTLAPHATLAPKRSAGGAGGTGRMIPR